MALGTDTTGNYIAAVSGGTGVSVSGSGEGATATISIGQAVATSSDVRFDSLGVGTAASGTTGEIRATNNITAFYSSDERLKEDVTYIDDALHKVNSINGVEFNWTAEYMERYGGEDGFFIRKHDVGLIAGRKKFYPRWSQNVTTGIKLLNMTGLSPCWLIPFTN